MYTGLLSLYRNALLVAERVKKQASPAVTYTFKLKFYFIILQHNKSSLQEVQSIRWEIPIMVVLCHQNLKRYSDKYTPTHMCSQSRCFKGIDESLTDQMANAEVS